MARKDEVSQAEETAAEELGGTVVQQVPKVSAAVLGGPSDKFSTEELRNITTFDDAVNAAAEKHGVVEDFAEEYGSGFAVVDKEIFVNKPLVLLEWRFTDGDFGDKFVSAVVVAKDGSKGIVNDGSTGIRDQLEQISFRDGKFGGLMIAKGLRVSEYKICPNKACGVPRKPNVDECPECGDTSTERRTGKTYYLDDSKN